MYADFGTLSFSAMSNSQPSAPMMGSETVHCGSPSGATSGSLRRHEIPAQEQKEDDSGVETGDHGEGSSPAPLADNDYDSSQEEIAESSGACGDGPSKEVVEDQGGSNRRRLPRADDDDDGYHTPTSPRYRIPADLPCPPAPRKMPPKRRWQKRNPGDREIYRVVRRRMLPGEFELVLRPVVDGPPAGLLDNGAGEDDIIG